MKNFLRMGINVTNTTEIAVQHGAKPMLADEWDVGCLPERDMPVGAIMRQDRGPMKSNGNELIGGVSRAAVRNGIVPAFRLDEWVKRVFDIVAATMGLIILSPILLITSIAIKLDFRAQSSSVRPCTDIATGRLKL